MSCGGCQHFQLCVRSSYPVFPVFSSRICSATACNDTICKNFVQRSWHNIFNYNFSLVFVHSAKTAKKWKYTNFFVRRKKCKHCFCFQVKAIRAFDINGMTGSWYIVQYYASSEEAVEYACMKCNFSMDVESVQVSFSAADKVKSTVKCKPTQFSACADNNGLQLCVQRRSWSRRIARQYHMDHSGFRNPSALDTCGNDMYANE